MDLITSQRPGRGWLLVGAALWSAALVVHAIVAGLEPLEADVLSLSMRPSTPPLAAWLLGLVARGGPPMLVMLRLVGLVAIVLGAVAGAAVLELCGARRPRTAPLAAIALTTHGAVVLGATGVSPLGALWAAEAVLLLGLVRTLSGAAPSWRAAAATASAAALITALAPAAAVGPLALAVSLARRNEQRRVALLLGAAVAAALILSFSTGRLGALPALPELPAWIGAATGVGAERTSTLSTLCQVQALLLVGFALLGPGRLPPPLRLAVGVMIVIAAGGAAARGDAPWRLEGLWLLTPPLLLATLWRLDQIWDADEAGLDHRLWLALLVATCVAGGASALLRTNGPDTRNLARLLAPTDRLECSDRRLRDAVEFHRPRRSPRTGARRRLLVPGADELRPALLALGGARVGDFWLASDVAPLYDLGAHLDDAEVTHSERGRGRLCTWQGAQGRFSCGGPEAMQVAWAFADFGGVEQAALVADPVDEGVFEIQWLEVPLGRRIVGVAGVDDASLSSRRPPARLRVRIDDGPWTTVLRGHRPGLRPFAIETTGGLGVVTAVVDSEDPMGRPLFFDLVVER